MLFPWHSLARLRPALLALGLSVAAFGSAACSLRSLDRLSSAHGTGSSSDAGEETGSPPLPDAAEPADTAVDRLDEPPLPPPRDAGPEQPGARQVLFVVGNVSLSVADGVLQKHLGDLGLDVVLVDDAEAPTVDTSSASLILISRSASITRVGARFRTAPQPIILFEPLLYDELGMVDATEGSRGTTGQLDSVRLEPGGHPLSAGLTGTRLVTSMPHTFGWGVPAPAAIVVATIVGQPMRAAVFGYEKGARMAALGAPARRVGMFFSATTASDLTADGGALLDAAVSWALATPP